MITRKYLVICFATIMLVACKTTAKKTNVEVTQKTDTQVNAIPATAAAGIAVAVEEPVLPESLNGNPTGIETEKYGKTNDSTPSLKWYPFQEGLDKAIKEGKILLVDSYTDWCYWCKVMDRETYSQSEVINYINKYFVAVKFNMENDGSFTVLDKKMSNVELYYWLADGNQTGFPTTMFWVNPGKDEYRPFYSGYNKTDEFMKILEGVKKQRK